MDVLVALDDSDPAWEALEYTLTEHGDAKITVIHVVDPSETVYGEYAHFGVESLIEERTEQAEELYDRARERAEEFDIDIQTETIVGQPARAVVEYATDNEFDHVVVGSHGRRGFSRVLLGSVAETVARRVPVPVTIVR